MEAEIKPNQTKSNLPGGDTTKFVAAAGHRAFDPRRSALDCISIAPLPEPEETAILTP